MPHETSELSLENENQNRQREFLNHQIASVVQSHNHGLNHHPRTVREEDVKSKSSIEQVGIFFFDDFFTYFECWIDSLRAPSFLHGKKDAAT